MPAVSIPLSGTVSTAFAIERSDRSIAIQVPSLAPSAEVRIQFSSGSAGADFCDLQRFDGTGVAFSVLSGSGPGWCFAMPATNWARLTTSVPQSSPRSFFVVPINR